jgi:hypothetical protein
MKNLLLCQLELVHYQLGKRRLRRVAEHHAAMGMMSRLAAVVPEEAYAAVKYVVEQVLHTAAGGGKQARPERCDRLRRATTSLDWTVVRWR